MADTANVGTVLADGTPVRQEEEVRVVFDQVVAFRASAAFGRLAGGLRE